MWHRSWLGGAVIASIMARPRGVDGLYPKAHHIAAQRAQKHPKGTSNRQKALAEKAAKRRERMNKDGQP